MEIYQRLLNPPVNKGANGKSQQDIGAIIVNLGFQVFFPVVAGHDYPDLLSVNLNKILFDLVFDIVDHQEVG